MRSITLYLGASAIILASTAAVLADDSAPTAQNDRAVIASNWAAVPLPPKRGIVDPLTGKVVLAEATPEIRRNKPVTLFLSMGF